MIINVYNGHQQNPQQYSYSQNKLLITLGRNPKCQQEQQTIAVDYSNASRTHLSIKFKNNKLKIKDLNSSNGTKVNGKSIQPDAWVSVQFGDQIVLGDSQGKIVITQRNAQKNRSQQNSESKSSSGSSRSRQKKKKVREFADLCKQLKISESTMKMLKQMTSERKSKEERIKFMKLMGCRNVQSHWNEIEQQLKGQNKYTNNNKKASEELQKQFDAGRGTFQKKGLGSK